MEKEPSIIIDLRSDTVTQPCGGMREAMARAEVGDDVNGDDPTVIRLQEKVASLLGMEAGLFVPSGTMSNAVAVRTHTQPGDEIIAEEHSHLYVYEGGGYAALSGCSIALVPSEHGIVAPVDVRNRIRKAEGSRSHYPNASLICIENTSNRGGGTIYPMEVLKEISEISREYDCRMHMDGARLFNAVVATGISASNMVEGFDSVSVCLSKGLGAPVGSVLVGSKNFIEQAHRWRKLFGGGMRQAGILAEAGIYALDYNLPRLAADHLRAKKLAQGIEPLEGLTVCLDEVQTNMVYVKTKGSADEWQTKLSEKGILCFAINENTLRMVIHLHINDRHIEDTLHILSKLSKV
jgi:threonine aldolase